MGKYYVESGPVRLVLSARDQMDAAVRAFQWTCERQAAIEATTPVAHVREAEMRGWQLADIVFVNERGFGRYGVWNAATVDVLQAWIDAGPTEAPGADQGDLAGR